MAAVRDVRRDREGQLMPLPIGVIKTGRMAFVLCADKLDALSRAVNRVKRCKICYFFDPGDGSTPGLGLCNEEKPRPVVFTQSNWKPGEPETAENWVGLKNRVEFVRTQVAADGTCARFTRYRLIAGLWGRG